MEGNFNLYDHTEAKEKARALYMTATGTADKNRIKTALTVDFDNNGFVECSLEVDEDIAFRHEYSFAELFREREQLRGLETYLDNTIAALWSIYRKCGEARQSERNNGVKVGQVVTYDDGSHLYEAARLLERVREHPELVKLLNRTYLI